MLLTEALIGVCRRMENCFPQKRTLDRAVALMVAALLCCGRKWVTRINCARGHLQEDWSSDYRLFSRSPWKAADLFSQIIASTMPFFGDGPIRIAGDETRVKRGGRKVKRSRWTRDPMSPPFQTNFMKGIRFMQFSALLPLGARHNVDCRSLPISFEPVDRPPKPGRKASEEELANYRKACDANPLGKQAWDQLLAVRKKYDQAGAAGRIMLVALDGSFCNRHCLRPVNDKIVVIARSRKDSVLCFPASSRTKTRRIYAKKTFTPESVRLNDSIPWKTCPIFYGGSTREISFKEVNSVLWRSGSGSRHLRLLVVKALPYQLSPCMPKYYRRPAYLLVTDENETPSQELLQCYFDRWQIEVNHRDEKQNIGIADAQVWNDKSVDRLPAFMVAAYSSLLLASLEAFGPTRTNDYLQPPLWQRKRRRRPSVLDLLAKLREEAKEHPEAFISLGFEPDIAQILLRAA